MSTQVNTIDVAQRSAPIKENLDGSCEWAGQIYPDYYAAYNARRTFRAITFGLVYGGTIGTNS